MNAARLLPTGADLLRLYCRTEARAVLVPRDAFGELAI